MAEDAGGNVEKFLGESVRVSDAKKVGDLPKGNPERMQREGMAASRYRRERLQAKIEAFWTYESLGEQEMPPKVKAFLTYLSRGKSVTAAARLAGVTRRNPWQIRQKFPREWAVARELGSQVQGSPPLEWDDVRYFLDWGITHRDQATSNQLKAIELWAKVNGLMDTKLNVTIERQDLENHLDQLMGIARESLAKQRAELPSLSSRELPALIEATVVRRDEGSS